MQTTFDKVKITHNGETKEVLKIIDNNYALLVINVSDYEIPTFDQTKTFWIKPDDVLEHL